MKFTLQFSWKFRLQLEWWLEFDCDRQYYMSVLYLRNGFWGCNDTRHFALETCPSLRAWGLSAHYVIAKQQVPTVFLYTGFLCWRELSDCWWGEIFWQENKKRPRNNREAPAAAAAGVNNTARNACSWHALEKSRDACCEKRKRGGNWKQCSGTQPICPATTRK